MENIIIDIAVITKKIKNIYTIIRLKELNNESISKEIELLKVLKEKECLLYKKINNREIVLNVGPLVNDNILDVINGDEYASLEKRRITSNIYRDISVEIKGKPADKVSLKTLEDFIKDDGSIEYIRNLIKNINAIHYDFLTMILNFNENEDEISKKDIIKIKYDLIFSDLTLEDELIKQNFKVNSLYLQNPIVSQVTNLDKYNHMILKFIFSDEIIDSQLNKLLNLNDEEDLKLNLRKNILKSALQFQNLEYIESLEEDLYEDNELEFDNKGFEVAIEAIEYTKKLI